MRKYVYSITLLATAIFLSLSSTATNYTNSGSGASYNLYSGDTLRVTTGTYQGNVQTFNNGAVIIVSASAIFKPGHIASPAGKVINYGVCQSVNMATYSGFAFTNNGVLTVSGNVSLYDGSKQIWVNNLSAIITIGGSLSMNNADFTNWATVSVGDDLNLYTATSNLMNAGLFTITGDINMSNGTITNLNRLRMNVLNGWGGTVNNQGEIAPRGNMVLPSGSSNTNTCLLIAPQDFTNYGNFTNNGLLWIGGFASTNNFINGGTFTNSANAVVRTEAFTNWGTVNGGGGYYITGSSINVGTVGRTGATTDTIKVYDVTRSSGGFFDYQWGTMYNNVVYRPFAQPDTNNLTAFTGCSVYYKSNGAVLLPVEWKSFDAKLVRNMPVISWSAEGDAVKYEVERSEDNNSFISIGSVAANASKSYSLTDALVRTNTVVYYRVKAVTGNGNSRYTETKMLKSETAASTQASVVIYPNPVKTTAAFSFTAKNSGNIKVVVKNASGQTLHAKSVNVVKGENNFALTETATLTNGVYFLQLTEGNNTISERFIKN